MKYEEDGVYKALTQQDIAKLIDLGTHEEKKAIAEVLNLEDSDKPSGEEIVEQLWWKFQTPLGYLVRTPTFNKICISVAKKFIKLESEESAPCFDVLNQALKFLLNKMLREMDAHQKKEFITKILSKEEIKETFGNINEINWSKIATGTILLAARNPLIIYSTLTSQIALALGGSAAIASGAVALSFLGPLGWFLLAWGMNDLLGTSWKQVVPATFYIYCIHERIKQEGKLPF